MITITDTDFMIEKYIKVLLLSDKYIQIQLKDKKFEIYGTDLFLIHYSKCEIRGKGSIESVRFIS